MTPEAIGVIVGSILAIVSERSFFWRREYQKHKTWSANGKDLTTIKKDVKGMKDNLGQVWIDIVTVKEKQTAQANICKTTVKRFNEERRDRDKVIIDLVKDKKDKR